MKIEALPSLANTLISPPKGMVAKLPKQKPKQPELYAGSPVAQAAAAGLGFGGE